MFKTIQTKIRNRRERKLRERLVLHISHEGKRLKTFEKYVLTGRFE